MKKNAKQRDRLRAVQLTLDGGEKLDITRISSRSKSFVEDWVNACRDGGINAIKPRKQPELTPRVARKCEQEFLRRVDASPGPNEVVSANLSR